MKNPVKLFWACAVCACLCIPLTTPSFATNLKQPAASAMPGKRIILPEGTAADEISKDLPSEPDSGKTPQAVAKPGKKIVFPEGAHVNILKENLLRGQNVPNQEWNWSDGSYDGHIYYMSGDLYTNYNYLPSRKGKLLVSTDFQCDSSGPKGYKFEIVCYDQNTGREAASWSGYTAPEGESKPVSVTFYNLNKNHGYHFQFVNKEGQGILDGTFTIEQQND